jgi:hypothetical protein
LRSLDVFDTQPLHLEDPLTCHIASISQQTIMTDHLHKPRSLYIHPTPFKPTLLSIPPSPFSPRTPLTPFLSSAPSKSQTCHFTSPQLASESPPNPLSWLWQCHHCHRNYKLGVTRRCLDDGHRFCSGTMSAKAWQNPVQNRSKRHRACASEFDYVGWKAWGRWRRGASKIKDGSKKDCWNTCDYPSECRWGTRFGIHTPVMTEFPVLEMPAMLPCIGSVQVNLVASEKTDFWDALITSATRRKSSANLASSPLVNVVEESVRMPQPAVEEADEDVTSKDLETLFDEEFAPLERMESRNGCACIDAV